MLIYSLGCEPDTLRLSHAVQREDAELSAREHRGKADQTHDFDMFTAPLNICGRLLIVVVALPLTTTY